ncbi:MAG: PKD domain-containing protein, partial [Thermodesulfobacteriota bacterium]
PDGDPITYAWFQVQGPQVSLQDAFTATPGFFSVSNGNYRFQLVVDDGELFSAPATVDVTVDSSNQLPVADAGDDFQALVDSRVCLDGSGSHDPDREGSITFSWSQLEGPLVTLDGSDSDSPCFTPSVDGDYVFVLTVSDEEGARSEDMVTVEVSEQKDAGPTPVDRSWLQKRASGGGCSSVGMRDGDRQMHGTGLIFVLTLFLPALGMTTYQKRRVGRQRAASTPAGG